MSICDDVLRRVANLDMETPRVAAVIEAERIREEYTENMRRAMTSGWMIPLYLGEAFGSGVPSGRPKVDLTKAFDNLKKSVKDIEAEPFDGKARRHIEDKILDLLEVGATSQAAILEAELSTRDALMHLKEWDYKLLPKATIDKFQQEHRMTFSADGLNLHIDNIEAYVGNPESGKPKDRLIPDEVLGKIKEAKERKLFNEFAVLWAERVPDPIVLGKVNGCEDYFFIAEWGDDITFEQLTKGE